MAGEKETIDAVIGSATKFIPLGTEIKAVWDTATGGIKNALQAIESSVEKFEDYRIKLTQASGATSKFAETLRTEVYALNSYGVSYDKLVQANVAIAETYSRATFFAGKRRQDFDQERQKLQELVTVNEKFGVSQSATIDLANKLGNSVFNSTEKVGQFSDTLLKFSRETGQPFNKVLSEFGSYTDRFVSAISSDKATQAFTTLELLARRANTSVSSLVGSISKFDDIDEAFSSGGQINRVLSYFGGSIDTLAMASASEEEKAKMLLESISGISEQFNAQMTDPNAKRSVLKELAKQTGFDIPTITGLLNKSNDLSKDLQSIIRTPVVTGISGIPKEDKKAMAMDLTTQKEVESIAKENVYMGPMTAALERMVANQKGDMLRISSDVSKKIDDAFGSLKAGNIQEFADKFTGGIKSAADAIGASGKGSLLLEFSELAKGTQSLKTTITNLTEETKGDKAQKKLEQDRDRLAKINEERKKKEHEQLGREVQKGIERVHMKGEVKAEVTVKCQDGTKKVTNTAGHLASEQKPAERG